MAIPFTKTFKSPSDLVTLLKTRGVDVDNELRAENYIRHIGYYRLSAYMYPFLMMPKTAHQFKKGTTFDKILDLYRFDKKLRVLLFNEIEKIEIAFREALANITAQMSSNIFWMTDANSYRNVGVFNKTLSLINNEYSKSSEDFITHFKLTYTDPFPPAWMLSEIIPFGTMVQIYKNLKDLRIKKKIAAAFALQPKPFESWITTLALTRNACCHHGRIWNKSNSIIPAMPLVISMPWVSTIPAVDKVYCNLCIIKYFLNIISPNNDFKDKILMLLADFPQIDLAAMGFPKNWENEPLWK